MGRSRRFLVRVVWSFDCGRATSRLPQSKLRLPIQVGPKFHNRVARTRPLQAHEALAKAHPELQWTDAGDSWFVLYDRLSAKNPVSTTQPPRSRHAAAAAAVFVQAYERTSASCSQTLATDQTRPMPTRTIKENYTFAAAYIGVGNRRMLLAGHILPLNPAACATPENRHLRYVRFSTPAVYFAQRNQIAAKR